jgi:hypothetical protein
MFENLFENYKIILHKDFAHVVDVESNACSAQFSVELTDPVGKLTKLGIATFSTWTTPASSSAYSFT